MGNCQAIDAATLVVQHPNGKVDKFYWAVSASEIMKMNPGHYVALLISTTLCQTNDKENCPVKNDNNNNQVRLTRIKLLRPTDTLVLGQVYRLITTQGLCLFSLFSFHLWERFCFWLLRYFVLYNLIWKSNLLCGF